MYQKLSLFLFILLSLATEAVCDHHKFGYVSYRGGNIGDDIQAIAAKQFLPQNSIPIYRELLGAFESEVVVNSIISGWYMHLTPITPDHVLALKWPPAPTINPLIISFHLTPDCINFALSSQNANYLKQHSPIGTRDLYTLGALEKRNIPCYFSGCLTLTLENPYKENRENVIYAVDISPECLDYLRSIVNEEIVVLTHWVPDNDFLGNDNDKRLAYANELLDKYRRAKCVVTERLHAMLPCLAFETPVLFIAQPDARFTGLKELVRHCTREEFLSGDFDFDFQHPSENPKDYLKLRKKLISKVNSWLDTFK